MHQLTLKQEQVKASLFQKWFQLVLGILYVGIFITHYAKHDIDSLSYFMLVYGVAMLVISLRLFLGYRAASQHIQLDEGGISFGKTKKRQEIKWNTIGSISMAIHSIIIHQEDKRKELIKVDFLNYKQRQTLKQELQSFAAEKGFPFSSKF